MATTKKTTTAKKAAPVKKASAKKVATKKVAKKVEEPQHIGLVRNDSWLEPFEQAIQGRHDHALWKIIFFRKSFFAMTAPTFWPRTK